MKFENFLDGFNHPLSKIRSMIGRYKYFYYVGSAVGNLRKAMFRGDVALVSLRADSREEADVMADVWSDVGQVTFGWQV
jgi:hypothetical protein